MEAQQIGSLIKVTRVMNAVAAGTTDQESTFVDMANFMGVMFITLFGTITAGAVTSVKLEQSAVSAGTSPSDIAGSSVSVADTDDNKAVVHDLYRPADVPSVGRYIGVLIDRATQNAVIDGVVAVQYGPRKQPGVDDTTTVVSRKRLIQAVAGTA